MLDQFRTTRQVIGLLTLAFLLITPVLLWAQEDHETPTQGPSEDEMLLLAIDRVLYLNTDHGSYRETLEFTSQGSEGFIDHSVAELLIHIHDTEYRTLIKTLAPAAQQGTIHLIMEDEAVYLCTPTLDMPMQISGSTDLFGDSSVTATAGISYSYDFRLIETIAEEDAGLPALRLELKATSEAFPYPSATLWVRDFTFVPIRATLYALSGDALVNIEYLEYDIQGEDSYLLHQRVSSALSEDSYTEIRVLDVSNEPISLDMFDPNTFCGSN